MLVWSLPLYPRCVHSLRRSTSVLHEIAEATPSALDMAIGSEAVGVLAQIFVFHRAGTTVELSSPVHCCRRSSQVQVQVNGGNAPKIWPFSLCRWQCNGCRLKSRGSVCYLKIGQSSVSSRRICKTLRESVKFESFFSKKVYQLARPRARWYHLRGLPLVVSECVCPQYNNPFVITRRNAMPSAMGLPVRISRSQELTRNANNDSGTP